MAIKSSLICWYVVWLAWEHWELIQWLPLCRQHFQMHYLEWTVWYSILFFAKDLFENKKALAWCRQSSFTRKSGSSIFTPQQTAYLECMGKIFWVEFQRYLLKFYTKYHIHTKMRFYTMLNIFKLSYLRACMRFRMHWNFIQTCSVGPHYWYWIMPDSTNPLHISAIINSLRPSDAYMRQ